MTKVNESEYAVLPQQSQNELGLSEWHSRLDGVISFLERNVGYSLLDDAKPASGGGVQLKAQPPWIGHKCERFPSGGKPREVDDEAREEAKVDDKAGHVKIEHELPTKCSHFTEDEAKAIKIDRNAAKYAHYPDDLVLVWRFAAWLAEDTPAAADKVRHSMFYKTVLQGVRLMHLCGFHYSDVVLTLAYASIYFKSTFNRIGDTMRDSEAAHVCTLLIFLAHSFVLDETCPLRCWQQWVFKKYCTLKVLDTALFRLFNLQGFHLQLTEEEEQRALNALLSSSTSTKGSNGLKSHLVPLPGDEAGGPSELNFDRHRKAKPSKRASTKTNGHSHC